MLKKEIYFLILLIIKSIQKETKNIFEPTKIKKLNIKNRLFRSSVTDNCFYENGHITENAYKYYEELSKEGTSIIFTGCSLVSKSTIFEQIGRFLIYKDEFINELKKLTEIVHKNKGNIIMQIIHSGELINNNIEEVYGPSKVLNPLFNSMNKELTKEEILIIEDQFVEACS